MMSRCKIVGEPDNLVEFGLVSSRVPKNAVWALDGNRRRRVAGLMENLDGEDGDG